MFPTSTLTAEERKIISALNENPPGLTCLNVALKLKINEKLTYRVLMGLSAKGLTSKEYQDSGFGVKMLIHTNTDTGRRLLAEAEVV
ncbi:hypothetical protein ACQPXB_08585 [Amycolatopsis sp. CA-161197]|uniref:hypothetical protein n=1 Tax=Amycolatopsis sp. CA-161197 TaxID=3239922 RepID=UPI003D8F2102